ncbi:MAG: hypothetical protein OER95_03360, partial [Acidimicrobiia bacterium]|nr:hypothetical protein [Acidimicrobiia bacterium]
ATRDGVIVSSTTVDHQQQLMVGRHLEISNGGVISRPWMLRWITMTELDDEAAAAGLNPAERFGDWYRQPFTSRSDSVISVYRPSQNS